jgi:hypothetical protein
MTTVRELHDRAMKLAERFLDGRRAGATDQDSHRLAAEAYAAELDAATLAFERDTSPTTRMILLRSAAHLAREARQWASGLDLAIRALGAEDMRSNRTELLRILDTLRTYEHLATDGVELSDSEVQLALAGPEAAPGFARAEEVNRRINNVRKLLVRNNMRRLGLPFDSPVQKTRLFREAFTPYVSVPRAASYAITMRFGVHEQTELPLGNADRLPHPSVPEALEELIRTAKEYVRGGPAAISKIIQNEDYAKATTSLLRDLSPDVVRVQTVGLTIVRNGRADPIALPSRKSFDATRAGGMPSATDNQALPPTELVVIGRLLEGSAKKPNREWATIVEDSSRAIHVQYDEASHGDIIDGYWKHRVRARIRRVKRERWMLVEIEDE